MNNKLCIGLTFSELKCDDIKDELDAMANDIIGQFLIGKEYSSSEAQSWSNSICDEIIKALQQQQRGFKFVCICNILP